MAPLELSDLSQRKVLTDWMGHPVLLTDFLDASDDVVPALLLLLVVAAATHVVTIRVLARQAAQSGRGLDGDGDERQDGQILHFCLVQRRFVD